MGGRRKPVEAVQPLRVHKPIGADSRQFTVENRHIRLDNFDREYVNFGGYFGTYDPCLFAAAPELLAACEAMMARWPTDQHDGSPLYDEAVAMRAAITAARTGAHHEA